MMRRAVALLTVGAALAPAASAAAPAAKPLPTTYYPGTVQGCSLHTKCVVTPSRAGYITRNRGTRDPTSTVMLTGATAANLKRIAVFVSSTARTKVSWQTTCKATQYDHPNVQTGSFTVRGKVRHTIRGSSTGECSVQVTVPQGRTYVEIDGYPGPLVYPPGFAP